MDKTELIQRIIQNLQDELVQAIHAAEEAHAGATHAESKAETQYDTIGLEHAYLAEGQSRRIDELRIDISKLENWQAPDFNEDDEAYLGACLRLESSDGHKTLSLFIAPSGGAQNIEGMQIITPNTPLGQALLGKGEEETITLPNGLSYSIQRIY